MDTVTLLLIGAGGMLVAGTVKGFTGLGLPTVAMALLTLGMDPRTAIALILVPMLASNLWQMLRGGMLRQIARTYWRFALVLMVTVTVSAWASQGVSDRAILVLLGVMILLFTFFSWRKLVPEIPARRMRLVEVIAATIAGGIGGMTAAWAAPMAIYLTARRVAPTEFVQASGFLITAGSIPLLASYYAIGHTDAELTLLSLALLVPTLAGFAVGEALRHRTNPERFRAILLIVFLGLGLQLIYRGLTS